MREGETRESSEGWSIYSPLHCLQVASRALLKCLGLDHASTSDDINTATQTPSRIINDEGEKDETRAYRYTISTQSVSVVEQGPAPSSGTVSDEQGTKNSEDVAAAKFSIFSFLNNLMIKRPPKPPVNSGRDGQHN